MEGGEGVYISFLGAFFGSFYILNFICDPSVSVAHLNIDGDIYQSAANQSYWLTTESGETLLQDFGHFTTATADIISPPPDCNCINVARSAGSSWLYVLTYREC